MGSLETTSPLMWTRMNVHTAENISLLIDKLVQSFEEQNLCDNRRYPTLRSAWDHWEERGTKLKSLSIICKLYMIDRISAHSDLRPIDIRRPSPFFFASSILTPKWFHRPTVKCILLRTEAHYMYHFLTSPRGWVANGMGVPDPVAYVCKPQYHIDSRKFSAQFCWTWINQSPKHMLLSIHDQHWRL